jgi:hypothetical protein
MPVLAGGQKIGAAPCHDGTFLLLIVSNDQQGAGAEDPRAQQGLGKQPSIESEALWRI